MNRRETASECCRLGERQKDLWNRVYAPKSREELERDLEEFRVNALLLFELRAVPSRSEERDG